MSDEMLKANKALQDNIENITSGGLQGEVPLDFKWMLGDLEIGILKSSIEIQAKVRKLLNDCSWVREVVDDNTQPLGEFLENIDLSKYAEALVSEFEGLTIEDFTDDFTEEELATQLEPHIASTMHRKKVVREIKKCGAKKDDLEETIKEMRKTLKEILDLSEKMAKNIPHIKQKMRDAIKSKEKVQAKCQEDKDYHWWARFAFGGLCVVGAVATVAVGIVAVGAVAVAATSLAGGAVVAGAGVAAVGILGTATVAAGFCAYSSHKKTLELSDYLEQLEGTLQTMDAAQSHVQKREADWLNYVHDPASQAQTDQDQVGKRVAKLPSSTTDKQRFQKDMEKSEKTLQKFDEGMTTLKESANAVLKVLHG
ncbi:Hypp268 [Branchiostoma lanceolatum]|uniref:Hypp268 protein n=1 Tax=Branchiostoma lanceolatum TaxID=7740 RepID=A0A8J9VC41_BRALA|nr:Hypp268 [Branchiostoma lanceolatum]